LNSAVWVPIVVAVIAPIGAYLLAARKMSGKVSTSDATQLWKEAGAIRDDYRGQLQLADARVQNLEVRIGRLEDKNDALVAENATLRLRVAELEKNGRGPV
jgi:hypothetical protein